jgi:YfiR/HmsC-like
MRFISMQNLQENYLSKFVILILILAGLVNDKQSFCQTRESLIKAGYIEKFTHFVDWPVPSIQNDSVSIFTIAVIGKNIFGEDLGDLFNRTKVKNSHVKIAYISTVDEIQNCRILFISGSEKNNLEKILHYTNGKPILTISDTKGFGASGVIINMFSEEDHILYEINQSSLEKSGLKINSLLLNYAKIIKSNG